MLLSQKLEALHRAVRRANDDLARFVAATFPVGTQLSWRSNRGTRVNGRVTHMSRGYDRFQVENEESGKRTWISSHHEPRPARTPVQEVDRGA